MTASNKPTPLIGIDLGTTHSLIAVWQDGKAHLITNALGSVLTPSVVSIADDGSVIVGQAAKDRLFTHPSATAQVFKRSMGTKKSYVLAGRTFAPEDLSAVVLQNLRLDAEHFLEQAVRDVIISVPAYFSDAQRQATKAAAAIAGLNVLRLINEPTAAALAYGLHQASSETQFMIVDLGGGTLDVSVVELFEGVIEIKASTGDNQLGGEDFTYALAQLLREQMLFWRQMSVDLKNDANTANDAKINLDLRLGLPQGQAFLHAQAERCKRVLTDNESAEWEAIFEGESFALNITQAAFEIACATLLERLRKPVERALRDSGVRLRDLTEVVLVGGASRMPIVQKMLGRMMGHALNTSISPDEAIALGAAVQAGLVAQDAALADVMMTDVCPYSLGIEIAEDLGAYKTVDGVFSPIIERNSLIPTSRMATYVPTQDFQSKMTLNIYQGEARFVKDNIALGKLEIALPKRKQDEVKIDVRFSYDVSGLLEVDVTIQPGGKQHRLSLLGQSGHLTETDIAKRSAVLATLKLDPREAQPNRALLARLDRLYTEHLGEQRDAVARQQVGFLSILAGQDPSLIARARLRINNWCQAVEQHNPWDNDDLFGEHIDADR